jgi:D-serine dehydratase
MNRVELDETEELRLLRAREPMLWLNPELKAAEEALPELPYGLRDIVDASDRLDRMAPLVAVLFPETQPSHGIIESELIAVPRFQKHMEAVAGTGIAGSLWVKADHALPVAGSIKARGGIYEVLYFAEQLALEHGLLKAGEPYNKLNSPDARRLFADYQLTVGSTGNLGLSIGITGAALGFRTTVHMSSDAKEWKKARLRKRGVNVVEHKADFSAAVKAGRAMAEVDPRVYFIDDERSPHLMLGYSVAALRLRQQLAAHAILVDREHPLFVYLPCGVGGAPAGLTFGLKHVFGDAVHCFFAEPVDSPCMLLGLMTGFREPVSVYDIGLTNRTAADGLAVGTASQLAGTMVKSLVSGCYTVRDDDLFTCVYDLHEQESLNIEPSAAAGCLGPLALSKDPQGGRYVATRHLQGAMARATHILWTTGGSMVPETEIAGFIDRGRHAHA